MKLNMSALKDQPLAFLSWLSNYPDWEGLIQWVNCNDSQVPENVKANEVCLTTHLSPEQLIQTSLRKQALNIVQYNSFEFEKEVHSAAQFLAEPGAFFADPCKLMLNPLGESKEYKVVHKIEFTTIEEKYKILETLRNSLTSMCNNSSFISDVLSIADELLTNCVYHADTPENRKSHLDSGKAKFYLAIDESRMSIACEDPNGKLDTTKLLERMNECYSSELAETINMGPGGAGIGSYMVHSLSTSYYAAVKKDKCTIVGCVVPLSMRNRKRQELAKNLHLVELEDDNE